MNNTIFVVKTDGKRVPFDPLKVEVTCKRAGASPAVAKRIATISQKSHMMALEQDKCTNWYWPRLQGKQDTPKSSIGTD